MRNCITVGGQWMYPRDAPPRLVQLVRAGLLRLDEWGVTRFGLAEANQAVEHAAVHGGPFAITVIEP